jgi:hypothetical protein
MPFDCTQLSTAGYLTSWATAASTAITAYQSKGSTTQADNDAMLRLQQEILTASLCLSTAINGLTSTSSDIASLNEQILQKSKELSEAQEDIAVAKDRVGYMRHPERNTSNYESWFPIDRPISIFSLIFILCLTLFLAVFVILLTLSSVGVDVTIFLSQSYVQQNTVVSMIMQQFTASFWILLIAFISVVIYFVKRN